MISDSDRSIKKRFRYTDLLDTGIIVYNKMIV